jgi:hypothetical protein
MNRAQTEAGLRSDAFRVGAGLSADDANRRQNVGLFNAGQTNTRNLSQAQLDMQRLMANTGSQNQFALSQAGLNENAARYGADVANQQSMTNADLAEQAYARALQAAGLTANIGTAGAADDRANLGLTADLGTLQRSIEQAKLNAVPTQLQMVGGLLGQVPYPAIVGNQMNGTTKGTTTTTSQRALMDYAAAAAQSAAMAFSDRRLKRNIEPRGSYGPIGLYRFNYVWDAPDAPRRTGVMADEVAKHYPEAVGEQDGYATVDYGRLAQLKGA